MSYLPIGPDDGLYYEHDSPSDTGMPTFVFVNPVSGTHNNGRRKSGPRFEMSVLVRWPITFVANPTARSLQERYSMTH